MKIIEILEMKPVIFGCGAVVGFGVGYIFFKLRKEKELDKAIEECNKVANEAVNERDAAREKLFVENVKDREGSDLALTIDEYRELYSKGEVRSKEEEMAENESPSEEIGAEIEENEDEEETEDDSEVVDPAEEEVKEANYYAAERRKPKFITADTFDYEGRGIYDKCDLYYYVYDDVLASEDEEIIDNIEHTVGNCLDKYGFKESDEGEIYVRNFYTMTDYRITKMFAAFSGENVNIGGNYERF